MGQHCAHADCPGDHEVLPPGVEPFADFGYTVGLFDLFDLPEIHLPAYPADDESKPFQMDLLGTMINLLAADMVRGELEPGGEVRIALCEHHSMVFALGQPGPIEAVSAFQCADGAECIPARWWIEHAAGADHYH